MGKEKSSVAYIIRFDEIDSDGNMFLRNSISTDNLNRLKISGQIKDYEIDENGVKVIKDFRLISVSI